jgi:hypothetical protein
MSRHRHFRCGEVLEIHFESGAVKVLDGKWNELSNLEITALRPFRKQGVPQAVAQPLPQSTSFVTSVLGKRTAEAASQSPTTSSPYEDLSWIPCTSNCVERLFSVGRINLPYNRKSLSPEHVNMILMLKANRDLWDAHVMSDLVVERTGGFKPRTRAPLWPLPPSQEGDDVASSDED